MIIRICTEDKNRNEVVALCAKLYTSFSVFPVQGYWKGTPEPGLVIEIACVTDEQTDAVVQQFLYRRQARELAILIKHHNAQEAVLLEFIDSDNELI